MIYVGIDDTDTWETRGTNQLAKSLARTREPRYRCLRIVRHQLLMDDRVPYTSKNGSASLWFEPRMSVDLEELIETLREEMRREFICGSDPGLCVATEVPTAVIDFGRRCQSQVVTPSDARQVAQQAGIPLEGLGGSCDGIVGALAAVGLAATANDGRVVQWEGMEGELSGVQPMAEVSRRNVIVRSLHDGTAIPEGTVDVGKKLRPNLRDGRQTLFVVRPNETTGATQCANGCDWIARRLP